MDRSEAPTSGKLQELREKGIVPYSPFVSRCAGGLLAVVVLYAYLEKPLEVKEALTELISAVTSTEVYGALTMLEPSRVVSTKVMQFLVGPIIAVIIGSIVSGLLQSKFLFRSRPPRARHTGAVFSGISFTVGLISVVVLAALAFRVMTPATLSLFTMDESSFLEAPRQLLQGLVPIIIVVGGISALIGWSASRIGFSRLHRMTKAEVMREMQSRE